MTTPDHWSQVDPDGQAEFGARARTNRRTMDFDQWLQHGIDQGWVSEEHCATHEGIMNLGDEAERWERGEDPCQRIVRIIP